MVLLELRTDHDIFHCLKSINGLSDSVVTRYFIMTVSFIYGHRKYNTIYALLFSLILSVSLKKNKVLYCEKFNLNKKPNNHCHPLDLKDSSPTQSHKHLLRVIWPSNSDNRTAVLFFCHLFADWFQDKILKLLGMLCCQHKVQMFLLCVVHLCYFEKPGFPLFSAITKIKEMSLHPLVNQLLSPGLTFRCQVWSV